MSVGVPQKLHEVTGRATNELIAVQPVIIRRRVSFGECDPAGTVYTPRFGDYLLDAFHMFMAVMFNDVGRASMPEATPMRGLEIDFRRMMFTGDWFRMGVYVADIRRRSFDLAIVAKDEEARIVFVGRLSPILTDRGTNAAVPLPVLLEQRLREYRAGNPAPAETAMSRAGSAV